MNERGDQSRVVADALIGAAAGAAAVWVMDRIDWFNFKHEDASARRRTQAVRPEGLDPAHVLANRTAEALGSDLEPKGHNSAGVAVHYAIGVVPGALYGALRHRAPALGTGRGTLFGLGLFLLEDEGVNPLTGLSAKPQDYPWQAHARGFVAHAAYGLVLDTAVRAAGALWGRNKLAIAGADDS